jgi:hypothetical protein
VHNKHGDFSFVLAFIKDLLYFVIVFVKIDRRFKPHFGCFGFDVVLKNGSGIVE